MAKRRISLRNRIWARARGRCEYCHLRQEHDPLPFHIEHIISKKHRGKTIATNLALSCAACNLAKASNIAGIDFATGEIVRLFHPRIDEWFDHFTWNGPMLEGTTKIGTVTIQVLDMNHPERIRLRRTLVQMDEWPPEVDS